jgi:hypothetical protein
MRPTVDICGQRFGRLIVVRHIAGGGRARVECLCDCGANVQVLAQAVKSGNTASCGCLYFESRRTSKNVRHGMAGTRTHSAWLEMRRRCTNRKCDAWKNYGGRGISVCDGWSSFEAFLADMGECPAGHELDRKDVNGNYEPSNCRWVDLVDQANNKRNNRVLPDGLTVAQAARRDGVPYSTAYRRHVLLGPAQRRDHLVQMEHPDQLVWE